MATTTDSPTKRSVNFQRPAAEVGAARHTPVRTSIDESTARRRLTARWQEQVELDPAMRERASLEEYIRRNLRVVMRDGLLSDYHC